MKWKTPPLLLLTCLLCLTANAAVPATPPATKLEATAPAGPKTANYTLAVLWIAYSQPAEYIFTINNVIAYKDLNALKRSITDMPAGSTITWAPSDVVRGDEPLRKNEEIAAFRKFCEETGVKLVIIPGG